MLQVLDLRELLLSIVDNYHQALNDPFEGHQLAQFIRKESKHILRNILNDPGLTVKGSPGMGKWTPSPWIQVFDKTVTDGAQEGIYVVYLFSDDMKRIYLTLNQGVTKPIKNYGKKVALRKLRAMANDIRENYPFEDFNDDNDIDLSEKTPGSNYEKATIFYKKYDASNLPSNEQLIEDLKKIIRFYKGYLIDSNVLTADTDFVAYTGGVEEGKRELKKHYVRERNPNIVKEAKKRRLLQQGELRCDVCGFSFFERYGKRGRDFIEAHHKKPIAEMQQHEKTRIEDIALVCANCHRMIHKDMSHLTIEELKNIIVKIGHK